MGSEWQTFSLADLYDFSSGLSKPRSAFGSGYPFLSFKDVFYNSAVPSQLHELVNSTEQERARGSVKRGDVFLTRTSETMDELAMSSVALTDIPDATFNGFTKRLRPKQRRRVAPEFARYYFRSPTFRQDVYAMSSLSTRASLNNEMLARLVITLPSYEEQLGIGETLGALDDRIDLLRQTNTTLEAIAQALFKSWFVDFDPVHASAEGREPEAMDATTTALFPSKFEESELGLIPKSWRITRLANLCSKIQNGGTPSRANTVFWQDGTIPWFKTGELCDGFLIEPSEFITKVAIEQSSAKLLPKHAVLMAIYAAPTVGRLGVLSQESAFNQACTGMIAKDDVGPWFLLQTLMHGRDWYNNRANGAAQQNISKAIVGNLPCIEPPTAIRQAFTNVAEPAYGLIEQNARRIGTLSSLRDTLLPRLISGKLRLPETTEAIETSIA